MNMGHEKTFVLAYITLFVGSRIRHLNARLQIKHDTYKAAVRSDARPRRIRGSRLSSRPGKYQTGTHVRQANSRCCHVSAISRV